MAKASPTQAWLWHRRLSHLNFDYINLLSKKDVVIGLSKLKYVKDQLCSSCEVSKAKRRFNKAKNVPSSKGRYDHAGCVDTRKSTSGGIQFLEAEYVALSASCAQVMWMRTQLQDYGFNYNKIPLYYDSQSAIAISCNPVQHSRTKHIHTRYHFIKEQVENGIIELYFVRTEYQLADMFTKALSEDRFQYLVRRIGMRCLTPAELEEKEEMEMEMPYFSCSQIHYHKLMLKLHKTFYSHEIKNQESSRIKDKDFRTNSEIPDLPSNIVNLIKGRLLASFQDDAKYEHVGQDTRSQGGKDDQDGRIKI
ncbi:retrovirus-related pol polyprotein from transposon TNT 1-94 [Tanacetum coccineum]